MRSVLLAVAVSLSCLACAATKDAASRDPMKCERDPRCAQHQRAFDCSAQCSDDPACLDRCSQVQDQTGTSAPH